MTASASFKKKAPRFFSQIIHAPADSFISKNEGMNEPGQGDHMGGRQGPRMRAVLQQFERQLSYFGAGCRRQSRRIEDLKVFSARPRARINESRSGLLGRLFRLAAWTGFYGALAQGSAGGVA
jgi:hypothetical protein